MIQEMIAMSVGGSSESVKVDVGTIPYGTGWTGSGATSTYKVTCGFKPKKICWYIDNAAAQTSYFWINNVYDADISETYYSGSNGNSGNSRKKIGETNNPDWLNLQSVDNDGFTLGYYSYRDYSNAVVTYIAIG